MTQSQEQIAEAYSNGEFEKVFPCLDDEIEWRVFGQFHVQGRAAVEKRCREIADYFKSVTTEFKQGTKIVSSNKVAVSGTAEFGKDSRRLEFVNACDIYEFCDDKLRRITSYCLTET